jgi:hypothetical protein
MAAAKSTARVVLFMGLDQEEEAEGAARSHLFLLRLNTNIRKHETKRNENISLR